MLFMCDLMTKKKEQNKATEEKNAEIFSTNTHVQNN